MNAPSSTRMAEARFALQAVAQIGAPNNDFCALFHDFLGPPNADLTPIYFGFTVLGPVAPQPPPPSLRHCLLNLLFRK